VNYKLFLIFVLVFSTCILLYTEQDVKAASELVERIILKILGFRIDLTLSTDKDSYCPPDVINVTVKIENKGGRNATGELNVRILDPDGIVVHSQTWANMEILVDELPEYFNSYYTVQNTDKPGLYTVESNFTYQGGVSYSTKEIRIKIGIGELRVYPREIRDIMRPGESKNFILTLGLQNPCRDTIASLNKSIGDVGDWVSFLGDDVFLSVTEQPNTTIFTITVNNTPMGTYYGTIYVNADDDKTQIPINLIINVTTIDFSLNVSVPPERKRICQGEGVYADLNITKYQPRNNTVNISMNYQILNPSNLLMDEDNETLGINDTPLYVKSPILIVPSNTELGYYTFLAILEYNSTFTQGYDIFEVISCIQPPELPPGVGPGAPAMPLPPVTPKYALLLNLSTDILTVLTGNRTSFIAYVKNMGTDTVKSVKISISGISLGWVNIIPISSDINSESTEEYLVMINVPDNAKTGVYELKIKAVDKVESETQILTLIIGKNPKEIADLMLTELKIARSSSKGALLVKDCIDLTTVQTFFNDAELAYNKGVQEYEKGDYVKAINWFEYAIPIHKKIVSRVDIVIEAEIKASYSSKFVIPPMFNAKKQFDEAESYLYQKKYEKICDPIIEIRNFIMIGLIFWPSILIFLIIVIIILVVFYRRKKRRESEKIIERVRERLAEKPPEAPKVDIKG